MSSEDAEKLKIDLSRLELLAEKRETILTGVPNFLDEQVQKDAFLEKANLAIITDTPIYGGMMVDKRGYIYDLYRFK